jgi:hypothetical protein
MVPNYVNPATSVVTKKTSPLLLLALSRNHNQCKDELSDIISMRSITLTTNDDEDDEANKSPQCCLIDSNIK